MIYQLTITSKNPKAIKFLALLYFQNKNKIFTSKTIFYKSKNKRKFITVLRSPHVNKTAQSQIEYRIFSVTISVSTQNISLYLVLLKKIKLKLFPEIKIKIKLIINKQNDFYLQTNSLNPMNFFINNTYFNNNNHKKFLIYIKTFDCFGELNLNKNLNN